MTIAFIFPGQGAQAVGMGKALADHSPSLRAVFEEVDDSLGRKLSQLAFEGPLDELTLTRNAQPALMAVALASARALAAHGVPISKGAYVAGHSLGEYAALAAAGALSLSDTARLLDIRGGSMQEAVPVGVGAMAALLGADMAQAQAAVEAAANVGVCEIANDNAPGQIVLSGEKAAVEAAVEHARANGVRKAMMLNVSAPFHCSLMAPAAQRMQAALADVRLLAPSPVLVANVTAQPVSDPEQIRALLVAQVTGRVRWLESVQTLVALGVTDFVELGAGKTLSAMIKRIAPDVRTHNGGTPDEIAALAQTLQALP